MLACYRFHVRGAEPAWQTSGAECGSDRGQAHPAPAGAPRPGLLLSLVGTVWIVAIDRRRIRLSRRGIIATIGSGVSEDNEVDGPFRTLIFRNADVGPPPRWSFVELGSNLAGSLEAAI